MFYLINMYYMFLDNMLVQMLRAHQYSVRLLIILFRSPSYILSQLKQRSTLKPFSHLSSKSLLRCRKGVSRGWNKRIKGQQLFCIPIAPVQAKYLRTYFYGVRHHQPKTIFDYQLQLCLLHDMVSISHKPRLTPFRHRRSELYSHQQLLV